MQSNFEEQYQQRAQQKLAEIAAAGFLRYPTDLAEFNNVAWIKNTFANHTNQRFDEINHQLTQGFVKQSDLEYTIQGRIMANRRSGKSGFIEVQQNGQRLQVYLRQDVMGESNYAIYKLLDRGDIIEVFGRVFRTTQGELTIEAKSVYLLTKCFRPLPDKFNGLVDHEACYRQRYVDLFVNSHTRQVFETRSAIISKIRGYLSSQNFVEVETPMLQSRASGAAAKPFATHHNSLDQDMVLRIAPELYLKRLIVGGFDRVFELNRNFRNEGLSTKHNPEFTMLEYYQAYGNLNAAIAGVQTLIGSVLPSQQVTYQNTVLDFSNWRVVDMRDAILEAMNLTHFCHRDFESMSFVSQLLPKDAEHSSDIGTNIITVFEHYVEPTLIQPTMVYNFPASVSPLAKTFTGEPNWAQRFEIYAAGMEIGNAYNELNDPAAQLANFQAQGLDTVNVDYIEALSYAMPPTVGVGIGIDRLVMILTDQANIRDVVLFPTMKSKA